MTSAVQATRVPKVNLEALDAQHADNLGVLSRYLAKPIDDQACVRIATSLMASTGDIFHYENIRQTVWQYKDMRLLADEASTLARQWASRADEWYQGLILPYRGPTKAGWVCIEVVNTASVPWKSDKAGQLLTLYCLTGHPAGYVVEKKVPDAWLNYLAYQVGFSRKRVYDYDARHFLGLRFWAYLTPKDDTYDLQEWEVTPKLLARNREIIAKRMRHDLEAPINDRQERAYEKAACPFDFDHYCFDCTKTCSECPASPHRSLCPTHPVS